MSAQVRRTIQRKFKIRGYTLKVDALNEILSFVNNFQGAEDEAVDVLLDWLHKQPLNSSIIDKEPVTRVIALLLEADAATEDNPTDISNRHSQLRVIDAFLVPKFHYDPVKRQFYQYVFFAIYLYLVVVDSDWKELSIDKHTGSLPRHGDASAKAMLYRDRMQLLLQRVSRDPHFSKPAFDAEMSSFGSCEISSIQSLVGQTGTRWIMGVISQLEEGHFYLEDLTASVEITTGFFSENTIIVAEGEMLINGIFQVLTCGFPPLEDRDKSFKITGGLDFFGGGILTKEETLRLADIEKKAVNDMFVILSDIWLDNDEKVMERLQTVLDGFEGEEVVPSLFVFMGNFCSRPCNISNSSFSALRSQFGNLGKIIESHPRLKEHSRFLFIPGPNDPGPSTVLPRRALPEYLTQELKKHVPNAIFSSNPCRVKFYTQEIVFFRQDLLYKMRRSCLIPPSTEETQDPFEHLVATITHQSHLCPLPLIVQPIIWNYDHCLHLYPTPHAIVLGDKSEQRAFKYTGITCFNPGSFANDSTFVAYRPCTQEVEFSAL
ncbi:hypothetical protein ACFE04_021980 [Oxalis oulophora]